MPIPDLDFIPTDMDIPTHRRSASPGNIRWLLRNLAIRNAAHPDFDAVITQLRALVR